jgi:excisionase family DNA binding protein
MENDTINKILAHKGLLNTAQVAEYLGVDVETARRWIHHGRIKGIKLTNRWNAPVRVEPANLAVFINELGQAT